MSRASVLQRCCRGDHQPRESKDSWSCSACGRPLDAYDGMQQPHLRKAGTAGRWLATTPPQMAFPRIGVMGDSEEEATANWHRSVEEWIELHNRATPTADPGDPK